MGGYICLSYLCMCRNLDDRLELNDTRKVSRPLNHWIWDSPHLDIEWENEVYTFNEALTTGVLIYKQLIIVLLAWHFIHACEILPESWLSYRGKTRSLW